MKKTLLIFAWMLLLATGLEAGVPNWKLPKYSMTAKGMGVRQTLDTFGVAQGVPVVSSELVTDAPFSGVFKDMPAAEFLDKVTTVNNLIWYYDGTAIYVYTAGEVMSNLMDLKYMKAGEVCSMLKELGVEDERFPIKTASNGELLLISGPPRYVTLVAETIAKADNLREVRTFNEIEVRMFPLMHTWADDVDFSADSAEGTLEIKGVATILAELMSQSAPENAKDKIEDGDKKDKKDSGDISAEEINTLRNVSKFNPIFRPDNRMNAVLIRDAAIRMPMYEKLIRQLDKRQKVIEITVTVFDLSKDDALDWQLSIKAATKSSNLDAAAGQAVSGLTTVDGLTGSGMAGAVSYLGKHFDIASSVTALKEKHNARSVFRTMVLTLNNMNAEISDKQTFYAKITGKEVADFEKVSAGTTLRFRPRIVPSIVKYEQPLVWLTLELEDGGFDSLTVDEMPMSDTTSLTTQAAVFNEESLLLAGYMRDVVEDASWGIPYLRDIPFIGWLFGGVSKTKETVQRMFVLTPRIIDLDAEAISRSQAINLRDISDLEELEEDAEEEDEYRELRENEIENRKKIRKEENKLELERQKMEGKRELKATQERVRRVLVKLKEDEKNAASNVITVEQIDVENDRAEEPAADTEKPVDKQEKTLGDKQPDLMNK